MLRKKRQGNTTQKKDKAAQHNSPKAVIFKEKLAVLGGIQTHDTHIVDDALTNWITRWKQPKHHNLRELNLSM